MAKALWIIRDEHARIAAVLSCLRGMLANMETLEGKPDFDLLHAMLDYMDSFVNTFHHPKEDRYLFKALHRRHPEAGAIIDELQKQHVQGAENLDGVRAALKAYERDGKAAFDAFRKKALHYVEFEKNHALTEEEKIFPLAEKHLTDEDWAELDAVFTAHNDPLFGDELKKEFEKLTIEIANRAPAPHGLNVQAAG